MTIRQYLIQTRTARHGRAVSEIDGGGDDVLLCVIGDLKVVKN